MTITTRRTEWVSVCCPPSGGWTAMQVAIYIQASRCASRQPLWWVVAPTVEKYDQIERFSPAGVWKVLFQQVFKDGQLQDAEIKSSIPCLLDDHHRMCILYAKKRWDVGCWAPTKPPFSAVFPLLLSFSPISLPSSSRCAYCYQKMFALQNAQTLYCFTAEMRGQCLVCGELQGWRCKIVEKVGRKSSEIGLMLSASFFLLWCISVWFWLSLPYLLRWKLPFSIYLRRLWCFFLALNLTLHTTPFPQHLVLLTLCTNGQSLSVSPLHADFERAKTVRNKSVNRQPQCLW